MYKMLIGIPAINIPKDLVNEKGLMIDKEFDEIPNIYTDFEVWKDNTGYHIQFETMLGFETENGCRDWIVNCLSVFTDYMVAHGYDLSRELDMYEVFTQGINVNSTFDYIEEAYAFMKLMVFGFHGKALYD